jgi:acyl-CoA thioester hydrolase
MPITVPIEIRFADIDRLQHVNNANYLTYFEQARLAYFEKVIGGSIDWSEKGIILARAEVDFLMPVLLEDKASVRIKISRLGNKSFDFSYELITENKNGSQVAARGKTVMVCINYKTSETIAIPEDWLQKVKAFEEFK